MTAPTTQDLQTLREFFLWLEELKARADTGAILNQVYLLAEDAMAALEAYREATTLNDPKLEDVLAVWRRVIESLEAGDQEDEPEEPNQQPLCRRWAVVSPEGQVEFVASDNSERGRSECEGYVRGHFPVTLSAQRDLIAAGGQRVVRVAITEVESQ